MKKFPALVLATFVFASMNLHAVVLPDSSFPDELRLISENDENAHEQKNVYDGRILLASFLGIRLCVNFAVHYTLSLKNYFVDAKR